MAGKSIAMEEARKLASAGRRVVAIIGWRVPTEPIRAAGLHPVHIAPDLSQPTPDADELLSAEAKPPLRALIQTLVSGDLDFAELIVFAPPFAPVSVQLEDLRRMELLSESVPPTYYFETMMLRGEPQRQFAIERTRAFARRIASLDGKPISNEALEAEISASNEVRRAALALLETRSGSSAPKGSAVLDTLGAGDWLAPSAHVSTIEALNAPKGSGPRLLLVSSSVLGNSRVHALAEEAGANIVAEDDIYGSHFASGMIAEGTGDPLAAIGSFIHDNQPMQRTSPPELRRAWYHEQLRRSDIDGVVFYAEDPIWGWDVPAMRAAAAEAGKPTTTLLLDVQLKPEKAQEQLSEFVRSLSGETVA